MVRPGRIYYEGKYEDWEEYLEKAAYRARQQRSLLEKEHLLPQLPSSGSDLGPFA